MSRNDAIIVGESTMKDYADKAWLRDEPEDDLLEVGTLAACWLLLILGAFLIWCLA